MDKRRFLLGGAGLLVSMAARSELTVLGGNGPVTAKRAWVTRPALIRQNCPQWCWAASIAMIFAAGGHRMRQETIVEETFGAMMCRPSGNPISIAADLSRDWTDEDGDDLSATLLSAYDAVNGVNTLSNDFIIDQLSDDKPLLYCNTHHAMVLVAVDYLDGPRGVDVRAAGVLDPWPMSAGFHPLSPAELRPAHLGGQLTFLAAVDIS